MNIYDSKENYESDLALYSHNQKIVFAMLWYIYEFNNGGHDQFYSNSTGIVWFDALKGFKIIELFEVFEII